MSLRSRFRSRGRPADAEIYRWHFLSRVHALLGRGFQEISHFDLSSRAEPAITGLLTQAIEEFLDDPEAPDWTDRFSIQDERHVNDSDREGKRRLRVDIELVSAGPRPRPRFQIEAKRLCNPPKTNLKQYLGGEGLGSFLSGGYAKSHPWAGMIGYLQAETVEQWATWIRTSLEDKSDEHFLVPKTEVLCPQSFDESLPHVYRSDHFQQQNHPIEIHHIFLQCF